MIDREIFLLYVLSLIAKHGDDEARLFLSCMVVIVNTYAVDNFFRTFRFTIPLPVAYVIPTEEFDDERRNPFEDIPRLRGTSLGMTD